jgi:hypothetical protein
MTADEEAAREHRRAQAQKLIELFTGANGRRPKNPQELERWLVSPKGKAALAYDVESGT